MDQGHVDQPYAQISFVFCTCRRLRMLRETVASVRKNLSDFGRVPSITVIDDNSSFDDRCVMLQELPGFTFVLKAEHEKGHAGSLNWMLRSVRTPYVVYWEDDCVLTARGDWIGHAHEVVTHNEDIVSVSFDQSIENDPRCAAKREWTRHDLPRPHRLSVPANPSRYHVPRDFLYARDLWPGFSLKPSLLAVERLRKRVGWFSETELDHMEYEFALRCVHAGARTAIDRKSVV